MQRIRSKQQKYRDGHKSSGESNKSQTAGRTHWFTGRIFSTLLERCSTPQGLISVIFKPLNAALKCIICQVSFYRVSPLLVRWLGCKNSDVTQMVLPTRFHRKPYNVFVAVSFLSLLTAFCLFFISYFFPLFFPHLTWKYKMLEVQGLHVTMN